jgi:hypothetical protein
MPGSVLIHRRAMETTVRFLSAPLLVLGSTVPAFAQDTQPAGFSTLFQFLLAGFVLTAVIAFFFWQSRGGPKGSGEDIDREGHNFPTDSGGGHGPTGGGD